MTAPPSRAPDGGPEPGPPDDGAAGGPDPGLCGTCCHARSIRNRRGSTFLLCRLSRTDDRFDRYPRLPVLRCPGYEAEE